MYTHRLGNLIEAYRDWSPERPASKPAEDAISFLPQAGMLVRRDAAAHTIVSAARGGVFKHFALGLEPITDAGLIVELADGRIAVSQWHEPPARVRRQAAEATAAGRPALSTDAKGAEGGITFTVKRPLHFVRFETATPLKQALFHAGMWTLGRFGRTMIRKILQRRLITGRHEAPLRLTRRFELLGNGASRPLRVHAQGVPSRPTLRVTDVIELTSPAATVRRMSFGSDHEAAYVAASGVYQEGVLQPWSDLARFVAELNRRRQVTISREW
jgi:hypothetical protein